MLFITQPCSMLTTILTLIILEEDQWMWFLCVMSLPLPNILILTLTSYPACTPSPLTGIRLKLNTSCWYKMRSNANAMHESLALVLCVDSMTIQILLPLMKRVHGFASRHFPPYRTRFLKTDLESAKLNLQGIWANMTTRFSDFGQNEVL